MHFFLGRSSAAFIIFSKGFMALLRKLKNTDSGSLKYTVHAKKLLSYFNNETRTGYLISNVPFPACSDISFKFIERTGF